MNSISSDIFDANRVLFSARFPDLASILGLTSEEKTAALFEAMPEHYRIETTRSPFPTLCVNGVYVHSRYDPQRDAQRTIENSSIFGPDACLFAGCALAYIPEMYAQKYPRSRIVLVEPDIFLFLLALAARPLNVLFSHPELVLVIGTHPRELLTLLDTMELSDIPVYESPAIMAPNQKWYDELSSLRKRNKEKKEINANTLKRFGDLWLRNMGKNLTEMRDRKGIAQFEGIFPDIPILILAAGPSLDRILPIVPSLRKHCVLIAVDTAVRACLRAGVEPDFIVLVDPQYWNYRHLDGLECPHSILITEGATWPAVFRFRCRSIHLCSSLFPLGKFLESRTAHKGELGAGGSVSTTAWDFARYMGTKHIYMAGLDLGFPDKKTHFTGSIFEERTHSTSGRLHPAETEGYLALYGAGPYPVSDYRGGTVLTDKRLILYAWWFESRIAASKQVETITLTDESVRIPGFSVGTPDDILKKEEVRSIIQSTLESILTPTSETEEKANRQSFDTALAELQRELKRLQFLSQKGIALCEEKPVNETKKSFDKKITELDRIDREILSSGAKEIAAMVLSLIDTDTVPDSALSASAKLYHQILAATEKNLKAINNFY